MWPDAYSRGFAAAVSVVLICVQLWRQRGQQPQAQQRNLRTSSSPNAADSAPRDRFSPLLRFHIGLLLMVGCCAWAVFWPQRDDPAQRGSRQPTGAKELTLLILFGTAEAFAMMAGERATVNLASHSLCAAAAWEFTALNAPLTLKSTCLTFLAVVDIVVFGHRCAESFIHPMSHMPACSQSAADRGSGEDSELESGARSRPRVRDPELHQLLLLPREDRRLAR